MARSLPGATNDRTGESMSPVLLVSICGATTGSATVELALSFAMSGETAPTLSVSVTSDSSSTGKSSVTGVLVTTGASTVD